MKLRAGLIVSLTVLMLAIPSPAQRVSRGGSATTAGTVRVDLSKERVGHESTKFLAVVGNWSIVDDGGKRVLALMGDPGCAANPPEVSPRRHGQSMDRETKSSSTT